MITEISATLELYGFNRVQSCIELWILIVKKLLLVLFAFFCIQAHASENGVFYMGAGSGKANTSAFSFGYLAPTESALVWGLDFSKEGSLLDSTYKQKNASRSALSFNLLLGANILETPTNRIDVAVLAGVRQKATSCQSSGQSNLGYQCYANADPDVTYGGNYGAVLAWSYKSVMLGVRVTGESKQALLGMKF